MKSVLEDCMRICELAEQDADASTRKTVLATFFQRLLVFNITYP